MKIYYSLIVVIALVLQACAEPGAMLDQARTANRMKLLQLQVGMNRSAVLEAMGTTPVAIRDGSSRVATINNPYRSEMYTSGGTRFEIFYYYTDKKSADDAITDDELTPLVMKDGSLDGWGWSYLNDVAKTYEIRLR